jgi:hypothetical protein
MVISFIIAQAMLVETAARSGQRGSDCRAFTVAGGCPGTGLRHLRRTPGLAVNAARIKASPDLGVRFRTMALIDAAAAYCSELWLRRL